MPRIQSRMFVSMSAWCVLAACGGSDSDEPTVEDEIAACYSHTPLDALPESHPDFAESPAAAASGFEGTFDNAAGDKLTIAWDGQIDKVRWECEDRTDLPQSPGGATDEFELPVQIRLQTADGDFAESMEDTLVIRADRFGGTVGSTRIGTGDNWDPDTLVGDFAPPSDEPVGRVHWSITFSAGVWTVDLTAYGSGGGLEMPLWMRTIRLSR